MPRLKSRASLRKGKRERPVTADRKWRIRMLVRSTGGLCRYCNKQVAREDTTIDHVLPLSKGGLDIAENLALACTVCNREKGDGIALDVYLAGEEEP